MKACFLRECIYFYASVHECMLVCTCACVSINMMNTKFPFMLVVKVKVLS